MSATPKVSVCMIAYKHEAFIRQAIESILSQDVEFQIELVIGDDCSPDGTRAVCEEYAARDARVRLLPPERNLGVMPNLVRTLRACTGQYIAVCEGDDYWTDPAKLRTQVAFLDTHPGHGGAAHQAIVFGDQIATRNFRDGVQHELQTNDLIGGRLFHTASVMFRQPALELFCNAPLVLSCDRLLNFCMSFTGPIHYDDAPMCAYRLHGGGMSSNASVELMKLDLNCIAYLHSVQPDFPVLRYRSYVYATIGLCKAASVREKVRYLSLSFVLSFADFPHNLVFIGSRLLKAAGARAGKR